MCYQVAEPLRSTFKTCLWLCVPLLSSCSTGNCSPGSFSHISLLSLLCGAQVLQSRNCHYIKDLAVLDEKSISSFSWSLVGSIWRISVLPQVLMVPVPGNAPIPAMVEFHSSASGVFSDLGDTLTSWVSPDPGWGASVPSEGHRPGCCAALTLSKAFCTVSEHSFLLKLKCWKTEIPRTVWVIQIK